MKSLFTILSLLSILTFSSCFIGGDEGPVGPSGPPGPQGPEGPQGEPGESGYVMEFTGVSFTSTNNYEELITYQEFPEFADFVGLESDVALVYFLWPTVENPESDIWRQLPQTVIHPEGLLQYNFDFTKDDVRLFLDADFDLNLLSAIDTDDWTVRVVIVPGEFWNTGGKVDLSDYNAVKEALGLPDMVPQGKAVLRR